MIEQMCSDAHSITLSTNSSF